MKGKILKVVTVILLLASLTMTNFVYMINGLISYANDNVATNNKNVEFSANIKDNSILELNISVKNEGDFNGNISVQNSNFTLESVQNQYIQKIENNTITLNQINAGTTAKIEIPIKPIKSDVFNVGLLNMVSVLNLNGIYKNNKNKEFKIEAAKEVRLEYVENNNQDNVKNAMEVITNKIVKVSGEDKRVVQLQMNLGLKDNNYPVEKIDFKVNVPTIEGKEVPAVAKNITLNTMTNYNYDYDGSNISIAFTNEPNAENNILWKKQGSEKAVISLVYDNDVDVNGLELTAEEKVTLYNKKELNVTNKIVLNNEVKDGIVQIQEKNTEDSIYKGKLYSAIDRSYESKTNIAVNLASAEDYIDVKEEASKYIVPNNEIEANVVYNKTIINKDSFDKIFGEQGTITIFNENGEVLGTVNAASAVDESRNIVIDYAGKEPSSIELKTTKPVTEGNIEIRHTKTIRAMDKEIVKQATELSTKANCEYGTNNTNVAEAKTKLEEATTQAIIDLNKNSLSSIETNNVEIRATLKSSKEQNDLYKNPRIRIILPSEIEEIKVNSINKLYADEMQVTKAGLETIDGLGKVISIDMAGEQKAYTSEISEGIQIVINADIKFSKTTPSKKANIAMKYTNENGSQSVYETNKNFNIESKYGSFVYSKVSNGKEVLETTSNEQLKLNIPTTEKSEITVERNIINNYETNMENVRLTGEIPELGSLEEINTNIEGSKIYYSEGKDGEWKENIVDISKAEAYKIEVPNNQLLPGQMATVSYKLATPNNLDYNLNDTEKLNVSYAHGGQNISEDYTTALLTTAGVSKNINLTAPVAEENLKEIGNLKVLAVSAGKELKDGEEINEGQTVRVKLQLTNTTGEELKNVKVVAKHDNAVFYDYFVTKAIDTLTGEEVDSTLYEENQELKQKEFTIETLKAGENKIFEYEYLAMEKPGEETKGTIFVSADNKEEQTIHTLNNKIKDADIKVTLLRGGNLEDLPQAGFSTSSVLSVKNISDKDLENIKIEIPLGEYIEENPSVFNEESGLEFIKTENNVAIFNINKINKGSTDEGIITFMLKDFEEKNVDINLIATVTLDGKNYISNVTDMKAYQFKTKMSVTQEGSVQTETVKNGDELIFTTTIKNESDEADTFEISDYLPGEAGIQNAYMIKDGKQTPLEIDEDENSVNYETDIGAFSEIKFIAETKIANELSDNNELSNVVGVSARNNYVESNKVTYKLEQDIETPEKPTNQEEPVEQQEDVPTSVAKGTISGLVWLDQNRDGQIDSDEQIIKNIELRLLNLDTGETKSTVKTDDNGKYEFKELQKGKYIVAIKYDDTKYSLTEYKKSGINESINSDFISKVVNGEKLGITDAIEINQNGIANINAGLMENKIFDLSINKYIKKITIQNSAGTTVREYNKEKIAKAEIHAKQIAGSTVVVEYGIDVKNEGEVAGYVNEIVDYIPSDMKFNSEMNKYWYLSTDKQLHNTTLANQVIKPGETKTVTVILTKTMTENNTGTTVNTAEIAKSSNDLAIADKDSTAVNKVNGEDDMSDARIIVSIKTGAELAIALYISIGLVIFMVIAIKIIKKRGDKNE